MRYLLSLLLLLFVSSFAGAQNPASNPAPVENSVQSDPKRQKKFNKEKAKLIKKQERDIARAKRDLIRMQDPATRKRMRKNLKKANKFNGVKHRGEDPYQ